MSEYVRVNERREGGGRGRGRVDRIRRSVRERERNRFYTLNIAYLGLWSTNDQNFTDVVHICVRFDQIMVQ